VADDSLTGDSRPKAPKRPVTRPDRATPAQRGFFGSIGLFLRQIIDELRKVVRPTRQEWLTYTAVVIAFVVTIMLFVFGLDQLFTRLVFWVFAGGAS
jgi:preprotein translocase subunit SecE